jgi:hypothetical protein
MKPAMPDDDPALEAAVDEYRATFSRLWNDENEKMTLGYVLRQSIRAAIAAYEGAKRADALAKLAKTDADLL